MQSEARWCRVSSTKPMCYIEVTQIVSALVHGIMIVEEGAEPSIALHYYPHHAQQSIIQQSLSAMLPLSSRWTQ